MDENVYDRLRPYTDIEHCTCDPSPGFILVDRLTSNPIYCIACKNEIDAEALKLDPDSVVEIAGWYSAAKALFRLWLASGEYEAWAKDRLSDPHGQVNVEGLKVVRKLCKNFNAWYWWFHDEDDPPVKVCPNCGGELKATEHFTSGCCEACRLVV